VTRRNVGLDNYYRSDKFKRILHEYEEYVKSGIVSFLNSEELTDVAEYYHLKGDVEKAYQAANYALDIFPGSTSPLAFLSRLALLVENDLQKAEDLADEIVEKTDFEFVYLKAEILIVKGNFKEANLCLKERLAFIDEYEKEDFILDAANLFADYNQEDFTEQWLSISHKKESSQYKEVQARLLINRGLYKDSESILNDLLNTDPYSNVYWNYLAQSQFQSGNYQESITSSEYSLAINPDDEEALLNKANGLFSLGNYKDALVFYQKYIKACNLGDLHIINVTIGHIYLLLNNIDQAYIFFHQALKLSKSKAETYVHIAMSAFDNGYVNCAFQLLSKYLPKTSNDWIYGYACLARCSFELGYNEEYSQYLRNAIEINEKECMDLLGDLYPKGLQPKDYPYFLPDYSLINTDMKDGLNIL